MAEDTGGKSGGLAKAAAIAAIVSTVLAGLTWLGISSRGNSSGSTSSTTTTLRGRGSTTTPPRPAGAVWLDQLSPTDGSLAYPTSPGSSVTFTVSHRAIAHPVGVFASPGMDGKVTYDIGRRYSTLSADFALADYDFPGPVHLDILGDGTPLAGADVTAANPQVPTVLKVTDVQQLTLMASTADVGAKLAGLGNAQLLP